MLKFFSARDDDNQSLLGTVPEGKQRLGLHEASLRTGWLIGACLCQKTADTAFGRAHSPQPVRRACARRRQAV